ncbi:MAG: GNAT family N-acetyltransferase [Acidobacteriota bacterium]
MPTPDLPRIRRLTPDDLGDALALSTSAGWNQQLADWTLLRALAGRDARAAEHDGRVVGTALAIDYGRFAWIAMMLVEPGWRGRGLGARLLEAALARVAAGRPVRLDATEAGRPLYRRHGFEDECRLTRLVAPPARSRRESTRAVAVRPVTVADLPAIAHRDAEVFGGARRAALEWALEQAPQYAWMVDAPGRAPQYCFGRPGRRCDQIGPVVADDDASAAALTGAGLASAEGRAAVVDAFDARTHFGAWLHAAGFSAERPLFRMCRRAPGSSRAEDPPGSLHQYAIFGPDFA